MGKECPKFHDVEIEKKEFHCSKNAIPISHVNTDKIVMSEAFPCAKMGSKYFGCYKNNEDVKPLYGLLPKMSWHLKNFDDAKTMSFSVEDEKLLRKYNEIWREIK